MFEHARSNPRPQRTAAASRTTRRRSTRATDSCGGR
jgi:hypothetical protein